ncbi:hypothetical protein SHKM778_57180 [Streptomyces sp. KM77-8]|uniref:Uncharacterized protein n=1 Tax=Streptomyces haneummycinicus TaxID=3074435 RepID=A0AAT9HNZ8_9ACTN
MSRDHAQSAERSAPATGSAETPFLELLARGASVEAYEQPVLLARAEGQPAERITALQQARVLALRVRAELEDAAAGKPSCPPSSRPPTTSPGCVTWTPCSRRSSSAPAPCSERTSPTSV